MTVKVMPLAEAAPAEVRDFLNHLTDEQRVLLTLKRELYDGDWRPMITDLRNRLEGRPYVVRLAGRIQDDLNRIEQMQALERRHQLDLLEFLDAIHYTETDA